MKNKKNEKVDPESKDKSKDFSSVRKVDTVIFVCIFAFTILTLCVIGCCAYVYEMKQKRAKSQQLIPGAINGSIN